MDASKSIDDLEANNNDDWAGDEHDDWEPGASSAPMAQGMGVAAEPEPEPEPDPFSSFNMAPSIKPTKRHAAVSAWERPSAAISGKLSMSNLVAPDADADDGGDGWGDDELDGLGGTDRRRAASERRDARRREREAAGLCNTSTRLKVAATKVSGD